MSGTVRSRGWNSLGITAASNFTLMVCGSGLTYTAATTSDDVTEHPSCCNTNCGSKVGPCGSGARPRARNCG